MISVATPLRVGSPSESTWRGTACVICRKVTIVAKLISTKIFVGLGLIIIQLELVASAIIP